MEEISLKTLELFNSLSHEEQKRFMEIRKNREKARELADSFLEMTIYENVPMEVMEFTISLIGEDFKEIKENVRELLQEQEGEHGEKQTECPTFL